MNSGRRRSVRNARVALVDVGRGEAGLEPLHALRRRTMRHLPVRNPPAGQRIVANLVGSVDRFGDVAAVEILLLALGPHAGKAVGLQLNLHRIGIRLILAHRLPTLVELGQDADNILHVVADFVRDDIGLREIARRTELVAQSA